MLEKVKAELEDLRMFIDIGEGTITESETEDKDWINNWKQYWHTFTIGDLFIKPTWEPETEEMKGHAVLSIDPGTAFGTGSHETTRMVIKQLQKYVKDGDEVLDVGVKAVNQDNELMLITTEGIIIRIKVSDTTLLGRITSGVKLINLDENVTVASIAKVREDKSLIDNADTSELLSEEEEKESAAIAAENAKKASVENTETDDELMKELLERAEADGSEDEEE